MALNRIGTARVGIALAFLGAWQIYGSSSAPSRFLVATPLAVAKELGSLLGDGQLLMHFAVTGTEALSGLLIGTALGATLGLLLWYSETVAVVLRPFILALSTLPVFALAPLMIVWFGVGISMKVFMAVLATVFVAFDQAYHGARAVSGETLDVLRGMRASRTQVFLKIVVPGSIDAVLASFRLNVGFCLLGAFIGEFIASERGLGYLILHASSLYNVPQALAAAFGIIILALLFSALARSVVSKRHQIVEMISVPRLLWSGKPVHVLK
jgi:NitT/TauT family transport system permease protein